MKKFLLSILCCLMAVVNGYADTYSYTFSAKQFTANGTKTLNNVDWTLSGDGGYWGYDGTKGQQFGSGGDPYTSLNFSTDDIPGTIESIVINTSGAKSINAKLVVTVGGVQYGTQQSLTASATDYTFTGSSSGEIVFSYTQTSSKAIYIKSITVTYKTNSSEPSVLSSPKFTPAGCEFSDYQEVEITAENGAVIYYTLDGSVPTKESEEYNGAITLTETTTVKAFAVKDGYKDSEVVEATYTKRVLQEGQVEDVLTREWTGIKNNAGYSSWSDLTSTSSAKYSGNSAGSHDAIQLRSNYSNSGIVTTVSGGKVKKIIVEWEGNTLDKRTLNVYGKNSAYTNPTDLYDDSKSKSGEELGTIVKGTSTELEITGDYSYIGLRSDDGAMYLTSITIIWEVADEEPEQTYTLKITDVGYATFTADKNYIIPAGVEGGIVTVEGTTANVNYVYTEGDIVPAGTGLLMKGAQGEYNEYKMYATTQEATEVYAENLLKGALTNEEITAPAGSLLYIFAKDSDSGLGFYWQKDSNNGKRVKDMAGKAYLQVPTTSAVKGFRLNLGDTTGITAVETTNGNAPVYTLSGVRVNGSLNNLPAGIYIVGGKKVYVK